MFKIRRQIKPLPNNLTDLVKIANEMNIPCAGLPVSELQRLIASEQNRQDEAKRQRIYLLITTFLTILAVYLTWL